MEGFEIDRAQERRKICANIHRERQTNRYPLTLDEWLATLRYFEMKCAYCLDSFYEELDHFIPMNQGGMTTVMNCVPSCLRCNARKGRVHPNMLKGIPMQVVERVRAYLAGKTPVKIAEQEQEQAWYAEFRAKGYGHYVAMNFVRARKREAEGDAA